MGEPEMPTYWKKWGDKVVQKRQIDGIKSRSSFVPGEARDNKQ